MTSYGIPALPVGQISQQVSLHHVTANKKGVNLQVANEVVISYDHVLTIKGNIDSQHSTLQYMYLPPISYLHARNCIK